jgi:cardiolipin synthase
MTQWLIAHFEILAGFLIGVILIIRVLTQRRSPTGTLAWLLVIVLMPYVGVPLYLMFGGRKLKRQARRKTDLDLSCDGERFDVGEHTSMNCWKVMVCPRRAKRTDWNSASTAGIHGAVWWT